MGKENLKTTASKYGEDSSCSDKTSQHSWLSIHRAGPMLFGGAIGAVLGLIAYIQNWL